jgi:hypothetical protein
MISNFMSGGFQIRRSIWREIIKITPYPVNLTPPEIFESFPLNEFNRFAHDGVKCKRKIRHRETKERLEKNEMGGPFLGLLFFPGRNKC